MASIKSKFSVNKIKTKLLFVILFLLFGGFFVFKSADAQEAKKAAGVIEDVGLTDGESDEGCKYSDQEGLVYFCGYVKNAGNYEPLEGITVAVYEELADGPSLMTPDGIFSPTGKWGGNLAHLFASTSTNAQGHYEIIARQGHDIHIAFLCGDEFVGGLKRIEDISRIEVLNDLVTCPVKGYTEPPPQLRYTDRFDFLECTANFVGTVVRGAEEATHFVDTVGLSGSPNFLMNSRIQVSNFDFRFMSFDAIMTSLNINNGVVRGFLEGAFDLDWYRAPSKKSMFTILDGKGYVRGEAGWIGDVNHGAWRMHDCRATYDFWGGDRRPQGQPCEADKMSIFLNEVEGLPADEDLYLVLNQLPFMPRFPSTVAWARIDIRNSIRTVVKDSAQEVRQGDALWDNYIGDVPRVYQKSPYGDSAQNERLEEKNESDPLISCEDLATQAADIGQRYKTASLSGLANPVEIPSDIIAGELMTEWEYDYPVCRGSDGIKTMREVCLDEPHYLDNELLCRSSMWCVKGAGGSVTPHRSQDDNDSLQREETIRQSLYDPVSRAAVDGNNEGIGTSWADQEWELNGGSRINVHNFNYMCGGFLLGREYDGKNYLNQYGNPTGGGPTDDIESAGDNCKEVEIEGNLLDDDPENDVIIELQCDTEEVANTGLGETPSSVGLIEQPSPNAIKNDITVQDVGTNNISHCSVSTMFERLFFDLEGKPVATDAEGNNKKLELLTYDDLRVPLDNPLAKAAYTILFNFFNGVPMHNEDLVVGTGTYYTSKSYKRDKMLDWRSGGGAEAPLKLKEAARDVLDSLRTLASRGIVIDFATIGGSDVYSAITTLFGDGSLTGLIRNMVGGTGQEQKSYAHRKSYEVTNPNLAVMVSYPLWEEPELPEDADPFKLVFFKPVSPWMEQNWGSDATYPWRDVPEGNYCATYVDWPYNVLPGQSDNILPWSVFNQMVNEENHDYRYQVTTPGLSRTCKVKDICKVYSMNYKCTGSYPGHMVEPGNEDSVFHTDEDAPYEPDINPHSESFIRYCSTEERETCAVKRRDTDRFNDYYEGWDNGDNKGSCACTEKCKKNKTTGVEECRWECPKTAPKEVVDCPLERAGPYAGAGRMDTKISNRVTQDSLAPDREEVTPVDGLKEVSDSVAYAFQDPTKMNRQPEYEFIKEYDIAHSKSPDSEGLMTQGYPVKSVGGINKAMFDPGSHPYTTSEVIEDNAITLHCEEPLVPLNGIKRNSCLDNEFPEINCWKCPIAPLPKCKGLFGEMEGIDEIVISPNGETAIKANFDFDNFEEMLPYYVKAEEETGVPCEVLGALHFREAGNDPYQSIWDGKELRGDRQSDVTSGADHLLSKMSCSPGRCGFLCGAPRVPKGLAIKNVTDLMQMIAYWGGGGNDNCNPDIFHLTDFEDLHHCPADYRCGEYDGYVTAYMDSNHEDMAIIWPMDKIDVNESIVSLDTLIAMFGRDAVGAGDDIRVGGIRSDAACYVISQGATNRPYSAVGALCPPPIPELRPGALAMAKYIYEFSVGLREVR